MNTLSMMEAMCNCPNGNFFIFNYGSTGVQCHFDIRNGDDKIELRSNEGSLYAGVAEVYEKWQRLLGAMPEYRPGTELEHQPAPAPFDDEISF